MESGRGGGIPETKRTLSTSLALFSAEALFACMSYGLSFVTRASWPNGTDEEQRSGDGKCLTRLEPNEPLSRNM